ncbi:MAG: DUF882 domain-containing protein [Cyanothece sp. SIO1E1]|nr:DUF882 domain-containing protein [Cyanothece sp. SIO1E1]
MHPNPTDEPAEEPAGESMKLPSGALVYAQQLVIPNGHLTWGELTKNCSRVPEDRKIEGNLIQLATKFEDIRQRLGNQPIKITSGYRPPAVNRAVGGASRSRHLTGEAIDIIPGIGLNQAYSIMNGWWPHALGDGRKRGFLHIDIRPYRVRFGY